MGNYAPYVRHEATESNQVSGASGAVCRRFESCQARFPKVRILACEPLPLTRSRDVRPKNGFFILRAAGPRNCGNRWDSATSLSVERRLSRREQSVAGKGKPRRLKDTDSVCERDGIVIGQYKLQTPEGKTRRSPVSG